MKRRRSTLLGLLLTFAGCSADPTAADIERCGEYCDACMVGPCITFDGRSGHCESASGRRDCILETEGDCTAISQCLMDRRDVPNPDGG